jgi:phosphoglycerate dehydrogenase-like enzyme
MSGLLISRYFLESFGAELEAIEQRHGVRFERIHPPQERDERLDAQTLARIELGFMSGDLYRRGLREYFISALSAPGLRWIQGFSSGTDSGAFDRLIERGVSFTNAPGCTAVPIAHTAIGGLLMLARGFLAWGEAQRQKTWRPLSYAASPDDLAGQRLAIFGLGSIGSEIARIARALGLHVTGVRRSPARPEDPIDAWTAPDRLHEILPQTQWLVLCAPLTAQTRGAIDAQALALLPRGARLINVARGPIVVESALIDALRSGQLGGAYLDVFENEPLAADSPLWDLPNVIVTPHNSAASTGNTARVAAVFFRNLEHWIRKEPLEHIVEPSSAP